MKLAECKRCGRRFEPEWQEGLKMFSQCCSVCMMRNLHDALGLPTPPELLDPHSKKPTLTQQEYRQKINTEAAPKRKRKPK